MASGRSRNNATWARIHSLEVSDIQTGDFDGNGQDDIVLNFAGQGIWTRSNNSTWAQLNTLNSAGVAVGDIDGDDQHRQDIVINFPGYGVYAWLNNATYVQLHSANAPVSPRSTSTRTVKTT